MEERNKDFYEKHFNNLRVILSEKGYLKKSPIYGLFMVTIVLLFYFIGLFSIGKIPVFFSIIFLCIMIIELIYISHELVHNNYFNNKINKYISFITGNILTGLSSSWWRYKHNIKHHTFTNSDIDDIDIREYDEIFTKNKGKSDFFYKYRTITFWLSNFFMYYYLLYTSYLFLFKNKKILEILLTILGHFILLFILFINFGLYLSIIYYIIIYVLTGLYLSFAFMVNHIGMEVIDGNKIRDYSWFDLQTRTTRNISGGVFINHIFGGLNKQIEHHLFPTISRYNILKASKIVKKYCIENNIKYHEVSFFTGVKEIHNTLKTGETK